MDRRPDGENAVAQFHHSEGVLWTIVPTLGAVAYMNGEMREAFTQVLAWMQHLARGLG